MAETNLSGIIDVTLEKLKTMTNAETIIGEPIVKNDITIIPVSRVSFGLATGGSDFSTKSSQGTLFGGGGGAGVTIAPVAFIVINKDNVRVIPITSEATALDKAISMVPELFDKVRSLFGQEEYEEPKILNEI
jgi:sporulation protein YtfJ